MRKGFLAQFNMMNESIAYLRNVYSLHVSMQAATRAPQWRIFHEPQHLYCLLGPRD